MQLFKKFQFIFQFKSSHLFTVKNFCEFCQRNWQKALPFLFVDFLPFLRLSLRKLKPRNLQQIDKYFHLQENHIHQSQLTITWQHTLGAIVVATWESSPLRDDPLESHLSNVTQRWSSTISISRELSISVSETLFLPANYTAQSSSSSAGY